MVGNCAWLAQIFVSKMADIGILSYIASVAKRVARILNFVLAPGTYLAGASPKVGTSLSLGEIDGMAVADTHYLPYAATVEFDSLAARFEFHSPAGKLKETGEAE